MGLTGLARLLRRRLWLVLLCLVVVTAAAVGFTALQEEKYSATATLLFRDPQLDQKLFGSGFLEQSVDPAREAETNVNLVSLGAVADRTAEELGRSSGDDLQEQVEVVPEGQSDLVSVTATSTTPNAAATIANTFAEEYIDFRQDADRQKIREAQRLVERELEELEDSGADQSAQRSLSQRLEELTVLASLQTGNAELVQEAEAPVTASSPSLKLNTALGVIVGLLLGGALALLFDRLDRRIREPEEIESTLALPLLGVIPESDALPKEGSHFEDLPTEVLEAFQVTRANLRYFNTSTEIKSVLVTSPGSGDGKTTVTWNLAAAAALAGARVALLEADMRRPALEKRLRVRVPTGLSDTLAGVTPFEQAAFGVPVNQQSARDQGEVRRVDVIFAGPVPPNPTDLIESQRMNELLHRLKTGYDAVFIDSSPMPGVSDPIPLLARVDGVVIVTRPNVTTRNALRRLASQLEHLDPPTLGVVVNGVSPSRDDGYGYSYGYGYGNQRATQPQPAGKSTRTYPMQQNGEPQDASRNRVGES